MQVNADQLKISIIGTGYVGLITGLCLSELGHLVTCADIDEEKINTINQEKTPIYEPGLDELLLKHLGKNFFATTHIEKAILASDITFIAVNTPYDGEKIDLTFVGQAAKSIGEVLSYKKGYHLVVLKSTVIPGTTDDFVRPILETTMRKKIGEDFGLCMNPEFMRAGQAVQDNLYPDRIIIGGIDTQSIDFFMQVYQATPHVKTIRTNNKTAEIIKYTANSLFATMISFTNEIANLCEAIQDVDIMDVMEGVYLDKRMASKEKDKMNYPGFIEYLKPGCGFGGSCFPKDVSALIAYGKNIDVSMPVLNATLEINGKQPERMLSILEKLHSDFNGLRVGILGVAFKVGTDDVRCSPALTIIEQLIIKGAQVIVYDPIVKSLEPFQQQVIFARELENVLQQVNVVMICTAWPEFNRIPELISTSYPNHIIIDGRRMFAKKSIANYYAIGLS